MQTNNKLVYPFDKAPRGETEDSYPSADGSTKKVLDAYRFLEDPDSEPTKQWVSAQNELTQGFLAECDQRDKLKTVLTECWNYPKLGIPCKHGDHYYFTYNSGLQNQAVRYKIKEPNTYKISKEDALQGTEVFIDPNTLAADGTASIGSTSWSEDGKYMAYNVNLAGSDWATIKVRDATTCKDLEHDVLKWVKFSGSSWLKDSTGFFYSKFDAPEGKGEGEAGTETEKLKF